ncbi:hypothetical protein SAMN04487910_1624 [Aquimarina amphilecti]|uniref:Uncharacterized protein n=1 Tax=Aquimarina amphilecti TaxID=1038014 RepID=A0A1H7M7D8_AQUAM|nr:DUF6544 family protein [Aquimarina amphilecti]SEL07114.1 hypothetical protein SAMN04487910_1624 [Aquimarina amphilecti]
MVLWIVGGFIILLILAGTIGFLSFNNNVEQEKVILFGLNKKSDAKVSLEDMHRLPDLVKNYLIKVGVLGKSRYCNVVFSQNGEIRADLDNKWEGFTAVQHMSSVNPGFIWKAKSLPILIRDKSINNKGEVKVSFLGLKNIVQFTGREVDQSSLARYLGELIWFPVGFLDPDISWEIINAKSVKAIMVKGNLTIEGFFFFDEKGLIDHFETKRYRDTILENFIGKIGAYKSYDGFLLPDSMIGIWDLNGQKLEYFKATITSYKILK